MRVWLVLISALLACGARTALEVDEAAPGFDTFPCRWSWGAAVELARTSRNPTRIAGGVHLDRNLAFVGVGSPVEELFVVDLATHTISARSEQPIDDISAMGGFGDQAWMQWEDLCWIEGLTLSGQLNGSLYTPLVEHELCTAGPPHRTGTIAAARAGTTTFIGSWGQDGANTVRIPLVDSSAAVYPLRNGDNYYLVEQPTGRPPSLFELAPGAEPLAQRLPNDIVGIDVDRLRGGVAFLQTRGDRVVLSRIGTGELGATPLTDVEPPAPVLRIGQARTPLVTTETDALFMLNDRLAWIPLSGSALRLTDPPPETAGGQTIALAQILLRPGTSFGGVAYVWADGPERVTTFRSLVCNR